MEIEMLEDLQLFEQHKAGRIRRRFEHREAAVIDADRLLPLGLEGFEIARRDQGPGRVESRGQPACEAAAVEGFGALGGNLLETARELGLNDGSAERGRRAGGEKGCGAARIGEKRLPIFLRK